MPRRWRRSCSMPSAASAITTGSRATFPMLELAAGLMAMWLPHPSVWGVVAEIDGRIVGSNFLDERDPIRGVGPISVAADAQNAGVGRRLREAVDWGDGASTPGTVTPGPAINEIPSIFVSGEHIYATASPTSASDPSLGFHIRASVVNRRSGNVLREDHYITRTPSTEGCRRPRRRRAVIP
jgi:hypothetical protein